MYTVYALYSEAALFPIPNERYTSLTTKALSALSFTKFSSKWFYVFLVAEWLVYVIKTSPLTCPQQPAYCKQGGGTKPTKCH